MTSIAAKTRERLLDVARQLFVSNGVERTTMNDIATASDKGRRTIYTYFKNKKEIYDAVVEREADTIVSRLKDVVESDLGPEEKLRKFIKARFEIVDDTISSSSATSQLISYITFDYKRLERIRHMAVQKERELFGMMLETGVAEGSFDEKVAASLPSVYQMIFQGVDLCRLRNSYEAVGVDPRKICGEVTEFILSRLISNRQNHISTQ
ncbi:MAG: TetR/AcrR family transcriptional regulator [Duncaniella sp.]|nr:TetR/AcrR family transcriptional regulator [Duncaniella sp.]